MLPTKTNKLSAEAKITKAKVSLVMSQPFFGSLALRLSMEEKPPEFFAKYNVPPTAATDGKSLYYSKDFIDSLSLPDVIGLLCHESLHVGMLHHTRRGTRDINKWQKATDYAVNQVVRDSKISLPEGTLYDQKFKGMSAEEIFRHMEDDGDDDNGNDNGAGFGSVLDSPATSSGDIAAEESNWKVAMTQAAHAAKMAGKLPAGLERLIEEMMEPKVDWGAQLREYLTDKVRAEDDWSRPNRRFIHTGVILPTPKEEPTGKLVVCVDTSGSITDKVLSAFQTEIRTIAAEVQPEEIVVIYCDAAVNRVQIFEKDDSINLKMCGGGGTDFRPPFSLVKKNNWEPHALVYLTDGYGPFPEAAPEYPTVWCMTTDIVAPFGHHVRVEIDEY